MTIPNVESVSAEAIVIDTSEPGLEHSALPPAPTAEQLQAVEQVMVEQQDGCHAMNLLGIWTSTVLLHDLAIEHFQRDKEADADVAAAPDPVPEG
jgi:hypothetical protein